MLRSRIATVLRRVERVLGSPFAAVSDAYTELLGHLARTGTNPLGRVAFHYNLEAVTMSL